MMTQKDLRVVRTESAAWQLGEAIKEVLENFDPGSIDQYRTEMDELQARITGVESGRHT